MKMSYLKNNLINLCSNEIIYEKNKLYSFVNKFMHRQNTIILII